MRNFTRHNFIYESVLDDWTPDENVRRLPEVKREPVLDTLMRFKELFVITSYDMQTPDTTRLE